MNRGSPAKSQQMIKLIPSVFSLAPAVVYKGDVRLSTPERSRPPQSTSEGPRATNQPPPPDKGTAGMDRNVVRDSSDMSNTVQKLRAARGVLCE